MKIKKHILTLSLILATVMGYGQSFNYQLNYGSIKFGNSATGQHQFNGLANFVNGITIPLRPQSDSSANAASTEFVKRLIQGLGSPLTFSNGLTKTGNNVVLGGNLNGTTIINTNGNILYTGAFGNPGGFAQYLNSSSTFGFSNGTFGTDVITFESDGFIRLTNGTINKGIYGSAPYYNNLNNSDSLVFIQKKYVDNAIASLPSSPVTSVNGRTGAVTGLAEASSLANYMDLTTNQTAAGNKTFTNNVATGGTLMVGSATGNNMFFDNSGSGYMSFSARNNGASQGMNWNAAEFFFNGKMSFPSGLLEYPSFASGNFVLNNARTAGSILFQNNGVNRLELTSSLSSFTGSLRVSANDGNANSVVRNSDIANKANLTGGNNFNGNQSIQSGSLTVEGNISAVDASNNRVNVNSTAVVYTKPSNFGLTLQTPTITNNRLQTYQDKDGVLALLGDLTSKSNLSGGNNFVGAQNIKGVLSVNPATGTYPFIQIADNGNLTAFESATSQIGINGSTGRLAFTRGGFTGTLNNPTLTANRTWNFPDQAGMFLLDMIEKKSNGTTGSPFYENIIRYGLGTTSSAIKGFNSYADNFGTGLAFYVNPVATANTETLSMRLNADASADFTNSVRASANDGNANTLVRNTDLSNYSLKTPVFSTAGTSATLVSSGRYIPQNASLTIYTLPTTAAVGDVIFINGKGAGGWRVSQNTGQVIHGATDTTTGSAGYVGSTARYNSIAIVCVTANTEWIIQSSQGSLTIN